ncbi:MAG: hypothetical protein GAK43_01688 [Stenotrophomonas maltophilia]|nr:MAG: hypothetical protein GAK43_01688 [Stenotrophomonas maltophilia]
MCHLGQQVQLVLRGVEQEPRHVVQVDGLHHHSDLQAGEHLGGLPQVPGQHAQRLLPRDTLGQAPGQHVDALRAQHPRVQFGTFQRLGEFGLTPRHGRQTGTALHEVARRQVEQHQRQARLVQCIAPVRRWRLVGELHFHTIETGLGSGGDAFEQRQLGEQQ